MTYVKSKYNIITKAGDDGSRFIFNSLYGTSDILSSDEFERYNSDNPEEDMLSRKYFVNEEEEKKFFHSQYMNFLDDRENDEIQIFYVPDYGCNFACDYCYQMEYSPLSGHESKNVIDAFFNYVDNKFAGKKRYFTLFGGEPLLPSKKHIDNITYFLSEAKKRSIDTAVVTNGYSIEHYFDILKEAKIREIQVTVDGMEEIHNLRRPLKGGGGTFDKIVKGIDILLENNIAVNLRMVVDSQNIEDLPKLAQFAIDRGWTKNSKFKTQLGRNYDLHSCQIRQDQLYSRVEMYKEVVELINKYPHILEFHKPNFHVLKNLAQNEELPAAIFDSCPGAKTEWAFDYTGKIFSCTATVGKKGEELGTFYPEVSLDEDTIEQWQDRDILEIEKCRTCSAALVCGGGCASVAKNKFGKIAAPDCRPVEDIVNMGFQVYFDKNGLTKI
ncbi:MAG: radical SAM protein [Deltaproteobacteria bacterium]|nr:radical SAM protein [Deltaproteobacteria bacterium]